MSWCTCVHATRLTQTCHYLNNADFYDNRINTQSGATDHKMSSTFVNGVIRSTHVVDDHIDLEIFGNNHDQLFNWHCVYCSPLALSWPMASADKVMTKFWFGVHTGPTLERSNKARCVNRWHEFPCLMCIETLFEAHYMMQYSKGCDWFYMCLYRFWIWQ